MLPNLSRSQSASATGFMPSYFKAGNSSQRGIPLMVNNKYTFICIQYNIGTSYIFVKFYM